MPPPTATASRAFFAYSPAIDPAELERARSELGLPAFQLPEGRVAEVPDADLVYNLPSPRWGGRIATLARKPGQSVFGLVYQLAPAELGLLRQLEEGGSGALEELELPAKVDGKALQVVTLTARAADARSSGPVSQAYANTLAHSAERAGLPAAYVTRLKSEALILERVQGYGQKHNLR